MRNIQCDNCNKPIDKEKEGYYSINEVDYNYPLEEFSELNFESSPIEKSEAERRPKSWSSWLEIDFCERCWQSPDLAVFRAILKKRIGRDK